MLAKETVTMTWNAEGTLSAEKTTVKTLILMHLGVLIAVLRQQVLKSKSFNLMLLTLCRLYLWDHKEDPDSWRTSNRGEQVAKIIFVN